jgi:hypothetical protein
MARRGSWGKPLAQPGSSQKKTGWDRERYVPTRLIQSPQRHPSSMEALWAM